MPRKQRSDKGHSRAKQNITSKSTDKEILNFVQTINAKIRGYYQNDLLSNEQKKLFGDKFADRVQNLLKFEKKNETLMVPLMENKEGALYIPKNAETVQYLRDVLEKQEKARDREGVKPGEDGYYTIATQLKGLLSFNERIKKTEQELKNEDYQKRQFDPSVKVIVDPKLSAAEKAANKQAAIKELTARYQYDWKSEGTFGEAIDKIYEAGDQELIAELNSGKWTGDLMERVNVAAYGYDDDENIF